MIAGMYAITSPILRPLGIITALLATAVTLGAQQRLPATPSASSPERVSGPVISPWGATYVVPADSLMPPADASFKVKFDVATSPADAAAVNPAIETLARFLNMHVRAGVPRERISLALVLHGTAARDALGHAGYRARHGVDNPNLPLLEALGAAGVRIYLCGQSAAGRGLGWEEIAPAAKVALSALTAHALLAQEGFSTNPF